MIMTYQQSVFMCDHSDKHFSRVFTKMAAKSTGIDMEQNDVTVTLSITKLQIVIL